MIVTTSEIITKEEAKRRIDESPGEYVIWDSIKRACFVHESRRISKEKSEKLIDLANKILYQDNSYFGVLSLEVGKKIKDPNIVNNLLFPQQE